MPHTHTHVCISVMCFLQFPRAKSIYMSARSEVILEKNLSKVPYSGIEHRTMQLGNNFIATTFSLFYILFHKPYLHVKTFYIYTHLSFILYCLHQPVSFTNIIYPLIHSLTTSSQLIDISVFYMPTDLRLYIPTRTHTHTHARLKT